MSPDYPDPSVDSIPSMDRVGPYYDGLLDLAHDRLAGPVQTRVRTWEDCEFEIRVFHGYGPHPQRPDVSYRQVLRYHSGDDELVEALLAVPTDAHWRKTLIHREVLQTSGVFADAGDSRSREKIREVAGGD